MDGAPMEQKQWAYIQPFISCVTALRVKRRQNSRQPKRGAKRTLPSSIICTAMRFPTLKLYQTNQWRKDNERSYLSILFRVGIVWHSRWRDSSGYRRIYRGLVFWHAICQNLINLRYIYYLFIILLLLILSIREKFRFY